MKPTTAGPGRARRGQGLILVGVDFSTSARQAILEARSLARERDARLLILHVIDGHGLEEVARLTGVGEALIHEKLEGERRSQLESFLETIEDGGTEVPRQILIAWGRPFEEILKKATDLSVELIVLGTAGRSADLERALFGSTAEKVLRATPCPVLCVPVD